MSKQSDRPFRAVVDSFTQRIANGELAEGDQLPTVAQVAEQFGLSRATVDRAMLILEDRELVHGEPGKGRWVSQRAQAEAKERLSRCRPNGNGAGHADARAGGLPQVHPGADGDDGMLDQAAAP